MKTMNATATISEALNGLDALKARVRSLGTTTGATIRNGWAAGRRSFPATGPLFLLRAYPSRSSMIRSTEWDKT